MKFDKFRSWLISRNRKGEGFFYCAVCRVGGAGRYHRIFEPSPGIRTEILCPDCYKKWLILNMDVLVARELMSDV